MDILHTPPSRSNFTLLSEHQSQTPASFHDGPTILYHHSSACTLKISTRDLASAAAIKDLASVPNAQNRSRVNGHLSEETPDDEEHGDGDSPDAKIPDVDVWVTSDRLILFSQSSGAGVSISYPSISLHAVQRPVHPSPNSLPALYLQLLPEANATFDDHDPDETISLYILPNESISAVTFPTQALQSEADSETETRSSDEVSRLYAALSACANLHPDPLLDDDDNMDQDDVEGITRGQHPAISFAGQMESGIDGLYRLDEGAGEGLPPPMPGSGGWITAENVGDFFDEDGNWRGRGGGGPGGNLGEGAGRVREREEEDLEEGKEDEETKWTRTG